MLANVANGHKQPDDGWRRIRRTRVKTLRVSVDVQRAVLLVLCQDRFVKFKEKSTHCALTLVFVAEGVDRRRVEGLPRPTVVVCYARLQCLATCQDRLVRVADDVDERDAVQADHLRITR